MSSYLYVSLIFVAALSGVHADVCADINSCLQPMARFDTVFDLLPWKKDMTNLCSATQGPTAIQCLDSLDVSACTSIRTLNEANMKRTTIYTVCNALDSLPGLLSSKCATKFKRRATMFDKVSTQCSGITRIVVSGDGPTCQKASLLKDCMEGFVDSVCGSEFKLFYDLLWADAPSDCVGKLDRAMKIYESYTPLIL